MLNLQYQILNTGGVRADSTETSRPRGKTGETAGLEDRPGPPSISGGEKDSPTAKSGKDGRKLTPKKGDPLRHHSHPVL
jgi:hypothetical protein